LASDIVGVEVELDRQRPDLVEALLSSANALECGCGKLDLPLMGLCWRIYERDDLVVCWGQGCAAERTGLQRRSSMTMWPRSSRAVPAGTARVARAAFPKGCLAIRIRDALGALFEDAQFAGLFATRGRPAVSPARLALVSVLGVRRGLSDRQAADAVRARIDRGVRPGLGACRHRL
jgi:hypothetical protein